MQSFETDDLDWLAFRYISNEMTGAEAESFEQRLADDQSAREAVARAVDLSQAVSAVPRDVLPIRSRTRRVRPIHWFAAAAASLAAGVLIYQSFQATSDPGRLAKLWAEHFGQEAGDAAKAGLLAGPDEAMSIEEGDDLTVPAWMIEAVGASDSDKWEDS